VLIKFFLSAIEIQSGNDLVIPHGQVVVSFTSHEQKKEAISLAHKYCL